MMGVFLSVLICGLSLDLGVFENDRLKMQAAADAAVLGAQVSHDQEDSNWVTNGQADAATNGYTNGANGVTVTVAEQPSSGAYAGFYDAIQATVTMPVAPMFMSVVRTGKVTVSSTSVALETPCVYLTGAHSPAWTSYPLTLQTASSVGRWGGSSMGCPVYVNKGISADSNSSLWENSFVSSGTAAQSSVLGGVFHAPRYGAATVTDPLSYLTQPVFSACTSGDTSVNLVNATKTLSPGTYCKGLNFTGSTITLNPGLYIICGGGSWTNSTVTGSGVTLFFTQSGDGNYGQFVATRSLIELSAPTSSSGGGTPGMLFWGDRNWVATSAQDFQFLYGYGNVGDGIFYTTGTGIEFNANTYSGPDYLAFVTDNMLIISTAIQPMSNFTSLSGGNPFRPLGGMVQ